MMAVAVVDDVLVLQLEGRQQVSDQGDHPGEPMAVRMATRLKITLG